MQHRYKKNANNGLGKFFAVLYFLLLILYVLYSTGYLGKGIDKIKATFSNILVRNNQNSAQSRAEEKRKYVEEQMRELDSPQKSFTQNSEVIVFLDEFAKNGTMPDKSSMFSKIPGDDDIIRKYNNSKTNDNFNAGRTIFHDLAVKNRPYPIIVLGTKNNEHANETDFNGVSPLSLSLLRGSSRSTDAFLKLTKINLASVDKSGYTLLHYAAKAGHINATKKALENRQSPNTKSKRGLTPLFMAAQNDNLEVFVLLLDSGGDPKISVDGKDCFHYAASNNKLWQILENFTKKNSASYMNFAEDNGY